MFIYLFPIFAFGLVITGIVFLGLQQASDLAKDLAGQNSNMGARSGNSQVVQPGSDSSPSNPAADINQS